MLAKQSNHRASHEIGKQWLPMRVMTATAMSCRCAAYLPSSRTSLLEILAWIEILAWLQVFVLLGTRFAAFDRFSGLVAFAK